MNGTMFTPSERWFIPLGIALVSLGLTLLVLRLGWTDIETKVQAKADLVQRLMSQRLGNGLGVLAALTGLQQATETMSNTQLSAIGDQLRKQYPYLGSIAYYTWTPAEDRSWFEDSARLDGYEQFVIRDLSQGEPGATAGIRDAYLPLSFLEPLGPTTARWLGTDALTDPALASLFDTASQTGSVETLLASPYGSQTVGLTLMRVTYFGHYMPEQADERRAQRSGAFVLTLDLDALTDHVLEREAAFEIALSMDATRYRLGERAHATALVPTLIAHREIRIGSRALTVTLTSNPSLAEMPLFKALVLGLVAAVVLCTLAWVAGARRHAEREAAKAAQALGESRIQYQDLFEGSIQGIMIHRDEQVLYVNQSFVDMLGHDSREEILALGSVRDILGQEAHRSLHRSVDRMRADAAGSAQVEYEATHSSGSPIVLVDSLRRVSWQGEPAVQSTLMNITERKAAERALIRVSERAVAAAKAKSEFLANMSHELRTPLNGVLGMLELLEGTGLDREQSELVEIAQGSGDALLDLINDVLDLSKLEAGRMVLEAADFCVPRTIETVLERLAASAHTKGVELVFEREPEMSEWLHGDAHRIAQILTNLVGNAIKFTAEGSVRVEASTERGRDARTQLRVTVRDTGVGIPIERQSQVFNTFTQADSSTTREYGGTGLGLTICRQLVEQMGGRIGVDSVLGEGSAFWFTLKLRGALRPRDDSDRDQFEPTRAIVFDPHRPSALALAAQLHHYRADAQIVTDVSALGDLLAAAPSSIDGIDIAFLDDWWPGGASALRRELTRDPRLGATRFVLMNHLAAAAEGVHADDFDVRISKPIARARLRECLTGLSRRQFTHGIGATGAQHPEMRSSTILVVEDNIVNQRVATGMLAGMGFNADVAANGEEALDALAAKQYDVVLMDCQMPVLDGYDTTRRIRADEGREDSSAAPGARRIPIIALTANAMAGDEQRCFAAGMDDYLAKPLRAEQLRAAVLRWMPADAA